VQSTQLYPDDPDTLPNFLLWTRQTSQYRSNQLTRQCEQCKRLNISMTSWKRILVQSISRLSIYTSGKKISREQRQWGRITDVCTGLSFSEISVLTMQHTSNIWPSIDIFFTSNNCAHGHGQTLFKLGTSKSRDYYCKTFMHVQTDQIIYESRSGVFMKDCSLFFKHKALAQLQINKATNERYMMPKVHLTCNN
jgi:hypothetical protein